MKKIVVSVSFFLFVLSAFAKGGEGEYAVDKIPEALFKNAKAVIRLEEEKYELKSLEKMTITHHYVITILNEQGDDLAELAELYDKFVSIESIEGTLYDASGKKIKSLKKNDIKDKSLYSDMSLATDGRLKVHNFYYKVYPYTIEYTIESIKKETMFFPQWIPIRGQSVSVEKSNVLIEVPVGYNLRYKTFNYNQEPVIKSESNRKIYEWAVKNVSAITREYASPSWKFITPVVMMAPSEFMIEDYKGTMNSWEELGKFQSTLNKGLDVLPASVTTKVAELVKDVPAVKDKIDILYKYMQSNTRYISVQMGIGGWRPFSASYVASNLYGDCKALSNYMYSLLKEAGIKSYYTLIKAGDNEDDIITDFPSRQFNHAIVCVPLEKDTIWLECTDQFKAAGYMGSFTGNRHALLIDENGGKLVRTPRYGLSDNLQMRNIKATLDETGTLSMKTDTKYNGLQQDELQWLITHISNDKVKERLHEQFDFATYEVNKFEYKEQKAVMPVVSEALDITVRNYATITGKRLFIIPNIMTRAHVKLSEDATRGFDIELDYAYKDIDSIEIELPKGYTIESMPKDISVKSQFGNYTSTVKLSGTRLYYYRGYEHFSGRYPAKEYGDLVKFYDAVYKADRNRIVLVKNETETAPAQKAF